MKIARWRRECSPAWPEEVVDWLRTHGSLTVRLQSELGGFKVDVRRQGTGRLLADEAYLLRSAPGRSGRLRQVTLWAGGQARVVAHTAVRWVGAQSDWPFWRQLGTRSLGSVLFRDRRVQRGALQFAMLPPAHPLARQATLAWRSSRAVSSADASPATVSSISASSDNVLPAGVSRAGWSPAGLSAVTSGAPAMRWLARRARYQRGRGLTPLVVTEVFLLPLMRRY